MQLPPQIHLKPSTMLTAMFPTNKNRGQKHWFVMSETWLASISIFFKHVFFEKSGKPTPGLLHYEAS